MMSEMDFSIDPGTLMSVLFVVLSLLIIYYFFLIRAVVEMIRLNAPAVVLVFAYISLVPFPLLLVLGIVNLIIWHCVREDLLAMRDSRT